MKITITSLALLLILNACSVSRNIQAPKPALPQAYRNAGTSDSTSIAGLSYKSFIEDKILQKLIDSAVLRNYDMQLAVKNITAARLSFRQVKWNYLPQADLAVTASSDRPSDNSLTGLSLAQYHIGSRHIEDYSVGVNISWEADFWGKIKNQSRSALAAWMQTVEARKAMQTVLVSTVSQGYYTLVMLDAKLAIARQNVLLNDSTLRIIRLQYTAGQVSLLAVQQEEALQLSAEELIPQFEQDITVQENALSLLAGTLPGPVERSAGTLVLPDNLPAGVPSALVSRRPDVKGYELALVRANAELGITRAAMYPALNITAGGGINSFKASNWFSVPSSLFGLVGGSIAQPLLDHRLLKTRYELAGIERDKSVLQFRQSVLNAVGEVSDALVKLEKLKEQREISARKVALLQHATANAVLLFKNGMATYLEVLTAQSGVLQSELELATIKRDEFSAVSDLYRSLGGGWN